MCFQLTVADIAIFDVLDKIVSDNNMGGEAVLKDFAEVKSSYQSVKSNPKIKAWLEKRPKTSF